MREAKNKQKKRINVDTPKLQSGNKSSLDPVQIHTVTDPTRVSVCALSRYERYVI